MTTDSEEEFLGKSFGRSLDFREYNSKYAISKWIEYNRENQGEFAVYVLRCTPSTIERENYPIKDRAKEFDEQRRIEVLRLKSEIFYVGYSCQPSKRIKNHVEGNGALFTEVFPPKELTEVTFYGTEKEAEKWEILKAGSLIGDETGAYSN